MYAHLAAARGSGLISHCGLTNYDAEHLLEILDAGLPVASNQVLLRDTPLHLWRSTEPHTPAGPVLSFGSPPTSKASSCVSITPSEAAVLWGVGWGLPLRPLVGSSRARHGQPGKSESHEI